MKPSEIPKLLQVAKKNLNEREYYRFEYLLDLIEESTGITRAFLQLKCLKYTNMIIGRGNKK